MQTDEKKTDGPRSLERVVSQRRETCQWTEDENGPHETECGHAFEFMNDGVKENGFKYCCFCGGAIILKLANSDYPTGVRIS